jgi:hypothetical protein
MDFFFAKEFPHDIVISSEHTAAHSFPFTARLASCNGLFGMKIFGRLLSTLKLAILLCVVMYILKALVSLSLTGLLAAAAVALTIDLTKVPIYEDLKGGREKIVGKAIAC